MSQLGRPVLVIGATGAVGSALCALFAADGHQVHAVGRDRSRLDRLSGVTGARTYPLDLTDRAAAAIVAGAVADAGVSFAVAAVGGWYVAERGLDLPMDRWRATLDSNLTAHFVAAQAFAPILAGAAPTYLALNGIASHYPCEGSLAVSVTGAAQRMMLDVLAAEGRADGVRFGELVVDTPVLLPGEVHAKDEATHRIDEVYAAIRDLAASDHRPGRVIRRHLG